VLKCENGRLALKDTGRIFYSPEAFERDVEPKVVAHRGAGDLVMPEASLPAYSNAVATGCNIVKLDLQRTKDGVVVMGHDTTLKRNMGWVAKISTLNYPDILEKGRFLDENGARGPWRIVRLDEALAIVKPVPEFWIDFKDNETFSAEFAEQVLGALKAAGIDQSRVMLATFNRRALAYFKCHHPSIRRVGHFSFNREKVGKDEMRKMALAFRDKYGLYGLNMPIGGFKTGLDDVAFLKQNGIWISLWFVQDEKCATFYKPAMPDAFVTDYVTRAREGWRQCGTASGGAMADALPLCGEIGRTARKM
jgi:glycerophosphoryl diester phosphodiesterase